MDGRTTCRACGAAIRFFKTPNGKSTPVNAEPVEVTPCIGLDKGGHVFVTLEGEAIRARKKREEDLFYDGVDTIAAYESHFATCPEAEHFRRKK